MSSPGGIRRARTGALLALCTALVGGCDGMFAPRAPLSEPVDLPLPEPAIDAIDAPDVGGFSVTLDTPGAEPRRVLRYEPAFGVPEVLLFSSTSERLSRRNDGEQSGGGGTLELEATLTPLGLRDGGLIRYEASITGARMTAQGGAEVRAQAKVLEDALRGVSGEGLVSVRGLPVRLNPRLARIPDASAAALVKETWSGLERLRPALPLEPVGVGGQWTAVETQTSQGMSITTRTTYVLRAIDGETLRLDSTTRYEAKDQQLEVHRMPKGTFVRLDRLEGDGSGTASVQLSRFVARQEVASSWEEHTTGAIPGTVEHRFVASSTSSARWGPQDPDELALE